MPAVWSCNIRSISFFSLRPMQLLSRFQLIAYIYVCQFHQRGLGVKPSHPRQHNHSHHERFQKPICQSIPANVTPVSVTCMYRRERFMGEAVLIGASVSYKLVIILTIGRNNEDGVDRLKGILADYRVLSIHGTSPYCNRMRYPTEPP